MDKLFLLDAYALIYRAYYAFIKNPRINSKGMNTSAVMGFVNTLNEILTKEQPTHIGVAFDHGKTFRDEAFPAYKAQREATPEDIRASVPIIKDIITAMHIPVPQVDGFEADDVIGTLATKAGEAGVQTYMLTPDKDYGQLVRDNVFIFRPRHGGGYETMVRRKSARSTSSTPHPGHRPAGADGRLSRQLPGLSWRSPKTATKLIAEFGSIDSILENSAKIKGKLREKVEGAVDDIRMSKFLATIRTDVPIDLDLDALKLQEPDTARLAEIFTELEFKSLLDKFVKKPQQPQKSVNLQLDLFAENPTEDAVGSEFSSYESLKTTLTTIN